MDTSGDVQIAEDQMSMLQDMVREMKEGFQTALKELTKIQDKEEGETYHSRKLQQQQQRQLDDLTETIHEIKDQLTSLTKSVKLIKDEQNTLKDNLEEIRSNRDSSQESRTHNDRGRLHLVNDFSSPEEWNQKLSDLPTECDDNNDSDRRTFGTDDNDVTVTACKSLILTQALSDKCMKLSLDQSSDEEEVLERRKVSYYAQKTANSVLGQMENRRHSMPSSMMAQGRNKDVGIVAVQRQKAVKELADLEREYCSKLWSLIHTYLTPLQTAGFLSARELGTLFPPYLEQMYAEHCHICTGLQDRLVQWTYVGTVAELLARITDSHNSDSVLSLYKEYVDDLLSAVTCFRRVQAQSSKFRSFLKAVKRSGGQREDDLMSLLLAPVQHIPKYLLQLQQVFRHTPPAHPDFSLLQTSLCRLQSFVSQLNEDLSSTSEVLNQERLIWSSSGQMLSARDSGVHSNSTEDDSIMPGKIFSKAKRSHVPFEWFDDPHFIVHHRKSDDVIGPRHLRASAGRFSALSQPDLTVYNNLNGYNPDLHMFAHIPRSRSTIPAGGFDSGDEAARERQYRKFKMRRRNRSPVDYTAASKGHLHRSLSPQVRPSSAIDFLSHHQQYQHQNSYKNHPVDSRKLQYSERQPRPHTVLGPHVTDLNNKPAIISRKHLRRPQHPIPTSTNFWTETTTLSSLPFRVEHQRMPLSAHDLLPKRPSLYNRSDVQDGDDEQEDDTKASDTQSLGTNGSHPYSSGQGSNNSPDLELDFYQVHNGEHNQAHNPSHLLEFSSAEVTASLARKLYDTQQGITTTHDALLMKQTSNAPETKNISIKMEQSNPLPGHESFKEQHIIQNGKGSNTFINHKKSEKDEENLHTNKTTLTNEDSGTVFSQKRDENVSSKSKIVKNIVDSQSEAVDEMKQISESNRQFLLSISTKSPSVNSSFSMNDSSEINSGNWTSPVNKKKLSMSNSDASNSSSPSMRSDLSTAKVDHMSQNIKTGSSCINKTLTYNGSLGVANIQSSHLPNKYSQPLSYISGNRDGGRGTPEATSSTSPQKNIDRSQISTSRNATYYGALPATFHDTFKLSRIASSGQDNHQYYNKTKEQGTSSISNVVNDTEESCKAASETTENNRVSGHINSYNDIISYSDSFELPPLEINDPAPDQDKAGKKGDIRRKIKDGGKFNSSDGLPKATDDPVSARKKMHFKSSIKNLFSKKKGQVILADVEKEVVKQMATVTSEGLTGTWSKDTEYSRQQKTRNYPGFTTMITCASENRVKEIEFNSKKGQSGSSSSVAKLSKSFHFVKEHKSQNGECQNDGNFSECGQLQHHVLECLNTRNKRYGIVVDNNGSQITNTPNTDSIVTSAVRQDGDSRRFVTNGYHSQESNGEIMFQPFQQKSYKDSIGLCEHEPDKTGIHVRSKSMLSFSATNMSTAYKGEIGNKELTGIKDLHMNEADILQSTDVDKRKILYKTSKSVNEPENISKNRIRSEKYLSQTQEESYKQRSYLSNPDLCQHCQKCEMKQRENVASGCERTAHDPKSGLCSSKSSGIESEKNSTAAYLHGQSQVSTSGNSGHISSNVQLNDLNEGNQMLFAIEPVNFSLTESIKVGKYSKLTCKHDKINQINISHPLSNLEQKRDQLGQKCKHCMSPPVQKQRNPLENQICQSSKQITNNMPDVTKISKGSTCSDKAEAQNDFMEMPLQRFCMDEVIDLVSNAETCPGNRKILSAASLEVYKSNDRNSLSVLKNPVSDNCDGRISVSSQQSNMSQITAKFVPSSSSGHCISVFPQVISDSQEEHRTSDEQFPRSKSIVLSQAFPNKDYNKSVVTGETQTDKIFHHLPVEDKNYFDHRYRLYYDDETASCQNVNKLDNPKSLKALSASSVIAEHFKQVPRDTGFNSNANYKTSDGLLDSKVQIENSLTDSNSFSESKITKVSDSKFSSKFHTTSNLSQDNELTTSCNSEPVTQFSIYRPFYEDLMVIGHVKSSINNSHTESPQPNSRRTSSIAVIDDLHGQSSDLRALLLPVRVGSQENESSHNLYDKEKRTSSSEVNESNCGSQAIPQTATPNLSDESSSYKPKNPIPPTDLLLSSASQCQSSRQLRSDKSSSEYQLKITTTAHQPASEQEGTSSSLNVSPCTVPTTYNNESHVQLTNRNRYRVKNGFQCSESYPHKKSGNDSICERQPGFLRPSSPSDLFSIRPYINYTASKASSDSGILVLSDHATNSLSNGMTSALKGSSCEKLDRSRRHTGSRNVRSGSEKDNKCKSPKKGAKNAQSSDDVESCQTNYPRKSRHSDGTKYSVQDKKLYPSQYPRYSADSSSLISNAFLQKMAHLSQHTTRSVSHPHIDGNHSNSSSRNSSIHGELSRKTKTPTGTDSNALLNSNFSRGFRITSSASKSVPPNMPSQPSHLSSDITSQINYEHDRSEIHLVKADTSGIQASPDLLLSNDSLKEETSPKEKSLSKKAQSFFSKLTHSPISLFYRDSKSSNALK